jgi:hypothetical protein
MRLVVASQFICNQAGGDDRLFSQLLKVGFVFSGLKVGTSDVWETHPRVCKRCCGRRRTRFGPGRLPFRNHAPSSGIRLDANAIIDG